MNFIAALLGCAHDWQFPRALGRSRKQWPRKKSGEHLHPEAEHYQCCLKCGEVREYSWADMAPVRRRAWWQFRVRVRVSE